MVAKEIKVAKRVLDADFLINVPTMKTHVATGVSLCLKNLKGVLPENEKRRSHFLGVNKFVTDLNSIVKPHLCVIDGTVAMEGDGPMQGTPVHLGVLVAGCDPVATDLIATRVMGLDPWEFKCFNYAKNRRMGVWREADISAYRRAARRSQAGFSACVRTASRYSRHHRHRRRRLPGMPGRRPDCPGTHHESGPSG